MPFLGSQEWAAVSFPMDELASVEMHAIQTSGESIRFPISAAHRDLLRNRSYWRSRRQAQRQKGNFPDMPGVYRGSIVWQYFVRQKRTVQEL
mgnify:CR=1 FL=1